MSAVLTNRLVGSAILLVAAVVFLPDLLDGQKEVNKDDFKAIPERPEFAKVAEPVTFSKDQHLAARDAALATPTDPEPISAPLSGENGALGTDQTTGTAADAEQGQPANSGAGQPVATAQEVVSGDATAPAQKTPAQATDASIAATAPSTVASSTAVSSTVAPAQAQSQQPAATDGVRDGLTADTTPVTAPAANKVEKPLSQAAFVVKVGSFGKSQNAEALVSKLKAAGYPAFTRKILTTQGTEMVSVLVGPELKRDKLEARIAQLQTLAQVQGLKVIPYQLTENN